MITQTMNGKAVKLGPNKMQGIGTGVIPKNLDLSVVDKCRQGRAVDQRRIDHHGTSSGIRRGNFLLGSLVALPQ